MSIKHGRARAPKLAPAISYNRILAAVDFSEPSLAALRYARTLAIQHDASLTVLHVVEPFHADMLMDTTAIQRERRRQALEQLRKLVARE